MENRRNLDRCRCQKKSTPCLFAITRHASVRSARAKRLRSLGICRISGRPGFPGSSNQISAICLGRARKNCIGYHACRDFGKIDESRKARHYFELPLSAVDRHVADLRGRGVPLDSSGSVGSLRAIAHAEHFYGRQERSRPVLCRNASKRRIGHGIAQPDRTLRGTTRSQAVASPPTITRRIGLDKRLRR
jgi:hypothetical protein